MELPQDDLSGSVIDGRYMVTQRLGAGGMGVVYKAVHQLMKREVAIKVLKKEHCAEEASITRFSIEARATAKLKNRHTVTIHDFGSTEDGRLYIAMEYLEGKTLGQLIRQEGRLDWRRAVKLSLQICKSLEEAHDNGILHRDLKPENVVVTVDERGREYVKVLDFGIAKLRESQTSPGLTEDGIVCGTPEYVSPEQARGLELDHRTDLYSLGVVLYEAITGRPPFCEMPAMSILVKQVNETPPPMSKACPDLDAPSALVKLVVRMLAKEPNRRPRSIAYLASRLKLTLGVEHRTAPLRGFLASVLGRSGRTEKALHPVTVAADTTEDSVQAVDGDSAPPREGDSGTGKTNMAFALPSTVRRNAVASVVGGVLLCVVFLGGHYLLSSGGDGTGGQDGPIADVAELTQRESSRIPQPVAVDPDIPDIKEADVCEVAAVPDVSASALPADLHPDQSSKVDTGAASEPDLLEVLEVLEVREVREAVDVLSAEDLPSSDQIAVEDVARVKRKPKRKKTSRRIGASESKVKPQKAEPRR